MTDCIRRDQLVDLLSVLDAPARASVDHLSSCPACRSELAALEQVRGLLRAEQPVPTEFVDSVMDRVEAAGMPTPDASRGVQAIVSDGVAEQQSRWASRIQAAGSSVLAAVSSGLAVAVVLLAAGSSTPAGIDHSPVALIAGGLFGCGLAVQQFVSSRRDQRPVY